jgi:hypothetical protein
VAAQGSGCAGTHRVAQAQARQAGVCPFAVHVVLLPGVPGRASACLNGRSCDELLTCLRPANICHPFLTVNACSALLMSPHPTSVPTRPTCCLQIGEEEERAKTEYKEERAEAKKKAQTEKAWEKTRDERVGSWRDFVGKKAKKTKTGEGGGGGVGGCTSVLARCEEGLGGRHGGMSVLQLSGHPFSAANSASLPSLLYPMEPFTHQFPSLPCSLAALQ